MLEYGPISWLSKNKSAIALSSTEKKYRGVVNASTQCLWLQGILREFGIDSETYTIICCDNQSIIQISTNPLLRQWTKHIDIHMHYIRGLVHDGVITLLSWESSEQIANIFTKVFSEKNLKNIKSLLGIYDHVVNTDWRQVFLQFCSCPCLREDFPLCGFASFLVLYGQEVCKG